MELIERDGYLAVLNTAFQQVDEGEGHSVLISGESGIGKTSLVKAFCKEVKNRCSIYQGTCDALFTPRPLAPLYDILLQMRSELPQRTAEIADRTAFFSSFFQELIQQRKTAIVIFEDIHWADEATLDFIKFLARRITQLPCLFILTYRDDEIHSHHPIRNVLGQLNPDSFTRLQLLPLSRQAVKKMAIAKGYIGEDVYSISNGNPFYVNEILASYSLGVPDNIKDSVLSVYNRLSEETKHLWALLSILPTGFEIKFLEKMEPSYARAIENCMTFKILIPKDGLLFFKHELYRRTIESSLSPLVRVELNKRILDLFRGSFEENNEIERIVHHAKNANDYGLVVQYAPLAAKKAASLGAHVEASRLYFSAIEYYQDHDPDRLIAFYEAYAYECYLTNQVKEAIIYTGKALNLWRKKNDIENIGNCMRFLSRLWWFEGNGKQAEIYGTQAIELLQDQPVSRAKAMAFSNMSQLKMLSDEPEECIRWGQSAIALAKELNDDEILSHALNNVGTIELSKGPVHYGMLKQSLEIALKNSFHEHAARAYTNLGNTSVRIRDYEFAEKILEEGLAYCDQRGLDPWTRYMLADKARLKLKTGQWAEAMDIAGELIANENQPSVIKIGAYIVMATVKMRRGETDALAILIDAKVKAFEAMELQRIIPALVALLEYEWISNQTYIEQKFLDIAVSMIRQIGNTYDNNEFAYWLWKVRKQHLHLEEILDGYGPQNKKMALRTAAKWQKSGASYEQALALFEGADDDKRNAISIIQKLGANAVYEKMKMEMRSSGIKNIPRGIRKSTQSNPLLLTIRELDVLQLLNEGLQNKEIANRIYISPKTVDHHISSIFFKLDVNSRVKAVQKAVQMEIIK